MPSFLLVVDEHATLAPGERQSFFLRRLGWLIIALAWVGTIGACEMLARRYGGFILTNGRPVHVIGPHIQYGEIDFEALGGVVVWRRAHPDRPQPQREKDGFRIVVLGDSILQPAMVHESKGTARQLEQRLNARLDRGPYEVVNLAEGGWNLAQEEQELITTGLPLNPDLVLVGASPNDIMHFAFENEQLLEVRFLNDLDDRTNRWPLGLLAKHSYLYNWLWLRWKHAEYSAERPDPQLERRTIIEPVGRMAAATREHNAHFAVICFPFLYGERFSPPRDHCPFEGLVAWATESDVPLLDPIPAYSSHPTAHLRADDIHLSPYGHRVLADAVFDWLVRERLVPYENVAPAG